ncbi:MAG: HAD-IIB family hydrolase [Gammaproteobacteria bacterium]|nr:HAD-IIB family hydrolase [Gammaproteobacteria bacterium]MDH5592976.1 HAD-IIB family hydrolase [Gammaproteobacteria bacterium]MDH5614703.1 HAD-IIB family hydrolase [Gammaproteobacteria bacterium]
MNKFLLCCDMDRTILPNGHEKESPDARTSFSKLADRSEITLVYVTGRHKELIEQAINEYHLPIPDFAVADVGSTIYNITDNRWETNIKWHEAIAPDWQGKQRAELLELLHDHPELELQEHEKQGKFKLSYYTPENINLEALLDEIRNRFKEKSILASFIWSIDDMTHQGLLDILPRSANKLHAIRFLMEQLDFDESNTVFAGDSGNDMEVFVSTIKSVVVGNATDKVKQAALLQARSASNDNRLFIATENYASGITEGFKHYFPDF